MQDHPAPCNTIQRGVKSGRVAGGKLWFLASLRKPPTWWCHPSNHQRVKGGAIYRPRNSEVAFFQTEDCESSSNKSPHIIGRCPDGKSSGVLVQMIILSNITPAWSVYWDCDSEKWRWQTQWSPILGDRRLVMGGWGIKWCRSVFRHLIIIGETSRQLEFLHFWKMFVNPVSTFKAISWSGCKVPHWG